MIDRILGNRLTISHSISKWKEIQNIYGNDIFVRQNSLNLSKTKLNCRKEHANFVKIGVQIDKCIEKQTNVNKQCILLLKCMSPAKLIILG